MAKKSPLRVLLEKFADDVREKSQAIVEGQPEAQLTAPVSELLDAMGSIFNRSIFAKAQTPTGDRLGIPDFGLIADSLLSGYVELKKPGMGADTARFRGRDKDQWERFKAQPNILYTDGTEWCLYRDGEPDGELLRFSKDVAKHGAKGISDENVQEFDQLLRRMLSWTPQLTGNPQEQATLLAPLCRLLRDDVSDALKGEAAPLKALAKDWRELLFPDADDVRFADSYAQTVTFALLLARAEGAKLEQEEPANAISVAVSRLAAHHTLLSRALQVLTDEEARKEIESSVALLLRVIGHFPEGSLASAPDAEEGDDPWLFFYEHFLAAYDPKLRKDSGVYYTPVQVVKCQVALVDELLRKRLGKSDGFASKGVITLDPAVGTGTYLLGVINHSMAAVAKKQGDQAVPARASTLAQNLYGFELMTGPYAVSELRLSRALVRLGASLSSDGIGVYLADTLESPTGKPPNLPQYLQPIAKQHARAQEVKDKKTVIVCLGNPPYDRHDAVEMEGDVVAASSRARTGGWVRWANDGHADQAILEAFTQPARNAHHGGDLKNLYNLYVYFWRWAIWKVFQHPTGSAKRHHALLGKNEVDEYTKEPGIVSFITASSYLRGDAFVGMREMLRRLCDDVWIIDLGGEGRGTRQDDNVFNIQTPVAIGIALRKGDKGPATPGNVWYASVTGSREEKYAKLGSVTSLGDLDFRPCPIGWHAPFRPAGTGPYFTWPKLTELMPWQTSGVKVGRLWPIAADHETLAQRWKRLASADGDGREKLFKNSPTGRRTSHTPPPLPGIGKVVRLPAIDAISSKAEMSEPIQFTYRAFDRHFLIGDSRVIDRPNPSLWRVLSEGQLYLTTLSTASLASGQAAFASALIPDLHAFRGSFGAKDVLPLYRDAARSEANILPGVLPQWGGLLKRKISPELFLSYLYAMLGHGGFVTKFWGELEDRVLHVPLTLDSKLFDRAVELGSQLLFLHTYGERFVPKGVTIGDVPLGSAKVSRAISDAAAKYPSEYGYIESSMTVAIGDGAISGVSPSVWNYTVSGLQVVASWLGYRMRERKGRKSSPLDDIHPQRWTSDFTDELLKLLWLLEHSIALQPNMEALLIDICVGPMLLADQLPDVPDVMRDAPRDESESLYEGLGGQVDEEEQK